MFDPFVLQFQHGDTTQYVKQKLKQRHDEFAPDVVQLEQGLALVQTQIEQQVKHNYEQYLDQMVGFYELEHEIGTVKKEVHSLQQGVTR